MSDAIKNKLVSGIPCTTLAQSQKVEQILNYNGSFCGLDPYQQFEWHNAAKLSGGYRLH